MKDKGLDRGLIRDFETSDKRKKGNIWGWRKMFWDYLNKMNVPFYDICCADASENPGPVRFNTTTGALEFFDNSVWTEVTGSSASATAITAFAGGGQTDATALTPGFNEITTVAIAGDSVKLPAATASKIVIVKNDTANSADVFPATGDTINDGSANTAIPIAPGATLVFYGVNTTNWETNNQVISTDTISEQTAAAGVTVDGALIKDGGISANSMYAAFYPTTAQQALSGAGAVNVTAYLTKFTSTGAAQALTIASGTQIGQMKRVWHVVDGGSGVMTGVYVGGTTITFTTVNEFADLMWTGTNWAVLALGNLTAGGASPALA